MLLMTLLPLAGWAIDVTVTVEEGLAYKFSFDGNQKAAVLAHDTELPLVTKVVKVSGDALETPVTFKLFEGIYNGGKEEIAEVPDLDGTGYVYTKVFADGKMFYVPVMVGMLAEKDGESIGYEIIGDKQSWDNSKTSGVLERYYQKYPEEDAWTWGVATNSPTARLANWNDRKYEFQSFGQTTDANENPVANPEQKFGEGVVQMVWISSNVSCKVKVIYQQRQEGVTEAQIPNDVIESYVWSSENQKYFYIDKNAKKFDPTVANYYQLYEDEALEHGTGIWVSITSDIFYNLSQSQYIEEYVGGETFENCWQGWVANGAVGPWIAPRFFEGPHTREFVFDDARGQLRAPALPSSYRILFRYTAADYEGKNDVMPWGDKTFGTSDGDKSWGTASAATEFDYAPFRDTYYAVQWNDNSYISGVESDDPDYGKVAPGGEFDPAYFQMLLLPATNGEGMVEDYEADFTWTRNPSSAIYVGEDIEPIIKVNGTYIDDQTDYAVQYSWTNPVTNEQEVVDAPVHVGTYTIQLGYEGDGGFYPLGSPKSFTITPNTLEVVLQQIYMPYGTTNVSTLEPKWVVKKADEDNTPTSTITVDRASLGEVVKGDNWAATDQPDELEPKAVRNYTTSSEPIAYVGRTYKQKMITVTNPNTQEEELVPAYNEDGDPIYTDEVDFPGYVDYVATTNTSSANIMVTKGTITITSDNFTKVYGYDDPDYMTATYQGEDPDAPFYTTDETKVGKKFFTAKNQAGTDMTDVIMIVRPDYSVKDVTATPMVKTTVSGEIDPLSEAVGKHTLGYMLDNAETAHYNVVFVSSDANQEEDPYLNIVKFNINDDVPPVIEEDPDDPDPEPTPEFKEKFIIEVANVEYNADRQYPDPKITFKHDVLGDIVLTKYVDDDPTKDVIGKMGQSKTEWYDAQEDYKYLKYPSAVIEDALIPYGGTAAWPGSYGWNKYVNRDTEDPAKYLTKKAEVEVTAKGDRFEGTKSGFFSVTPAPLSVKVIGDKSRDNQSRIYAGQFPNFGIELDDEVEESVTKYGWPAAEPAAKQTAVLTALGEAITAYKPAVEGAPNYNAETKTAYGYVGYDGMVTDMNAETVVPYTITVADAAKSATNVILAANNYTPVYASGDNTVVPIDLEFAVIDQEFDYATDGTNATEYTYNTPTINTIVALEDKAAVVGEKWTQAEIEAAAEGDPAFGKTTDDWKVEPADAIQKSVNLTSGTMPDGVTINDLFSAISFKDDKVITAACEKDGANYTPHAGVLTLTKTAAADNPGYNITITNGNWTVKPLTVMHLDYTNVGQALQDHQGFKMDQCYMPNRNLKNKNWYAMVLPFEISAPLFFADAALGYGAFEVQDVNNSTADVVRFSLTIENIAPNTPFILKVYKDWTKERGETNSLCDLAFDNVTIAELPEGQAYNDLTKSPYSVDQKGNKFVGQYTGKGDTEETTFTKKEKYMGSGEFWWGRPWNDANPTVISPTTAFLQFPTVEAATKAQILIQEPDGTYTALKGVEADVEANANNAEGIFNLSGQRVNKAQKGIYIVNGKKVLVK